MNKVKVLIIGSNGLVGSNCAKFYSQIEEIETLAISRDGADIRNFFELEKIFSDFRPNIVIHSAALVGGIQANINHPSSFILDNIEMSSNVIKLCHEFNIEKLVTFGSSCMYPANSLQPMSEELIFQGEVEKSSRFYATAKMANLRLIESFNLEFGHKWLNLIPATIFGPGDNFSLNNSHVISALIRKFYDAKKLNLNEVILWGDGSPRREFIFIDDLIRAIDFFIKLPEVPVPLNLGVGEDLTIKDLATKIALLVNYEGKISWDTSKPNGAFRKLLDSSKAFKLGWKPTTPLELGLNSTLEFYIGSKGVRK